MGLQKLCKATKVKPCSSTALLFLWMDVGSIYTTFFLFQISPQALMEPEDSDRPPLAAPPLINPSAFPLSLSTAPSSPEGTPFVSFEFGREGLCSTPPGEALYDIPIPQFLNNTYDLVDGKEGLCSTTPGEALYDIPIPPFLNNTYDLVDGKEGLCSTPPGEALYDIPIPPILNNTYDLVDGREDLCSTSALYDTPIPPFLNKIYDLVDDPSLDAIICWSPNGDSFVVQEPIEFARTILPRNFKHNQLGSFVRQLNTYGFRKIDANKWEFANRGFIKGQRHLLKTIQRRQSPHSQQIESSSCSFEDAQKATIEGEIERLRKVKSLMIQEIIHLQHLQHGTEQHMEVVNEKIQKVEKKQKYMVSFLAKIIQNPSLLARFQPREQNNITSPTRREQNDITSLRMPQEHQPYETGGPSSSSSKSQATRYHHELDDPFTCEQLPDYPLSDYPVISAGNVPYQVENVPEDWAIIHEFLKCPEPAECVPAPITTHPILSMVDPPSQSSTEYFISFSPNDDVEKKKNSVDIMISESVAITEGNWSTGFELSAGTSSSTTGFEYSSGTSSSTVGFEPSAGTSSSTLWGNIDLSDTWDIDSLFAEGLKWHE